MAGRPQKAPDEISPKENYYPVPIHTYQENDLIEQKLYFLYQGQYVFFQEKGQEWRKEDSEKLQNFGITDLYIKVDSEEQWHQFMEAKMKKLLHEPKMTVPEKAKVIYLTCVSTAEDVFKNPKSPEIAQRSANFLRHCIDYLNRDRDAFYELFKASALNMSEHSHGLHVAAYAITMAKQLGYTSEQELLNLGVGALLHDLGKTKISRVILDKPEKLTPMEAKELQRHPKYGVEIIAQYGNAIPELSRRIVVQHHERIDGSGYPHNLQRHEIHVFSQIVGIADVFDSMTSHRPYKSKASPLESVSEMLQLDHQKFDKNLLVAFIEMMKKRE